MTQEKNRYQFKWKKIFKIFIFSFLGIFVLANLLVILSGKFYLYKAVGSTYLRGQSGPGIYDSAIFYNRVIENDLPSPWIKDENNLKLNKEDLVLLEDFQTTSFLITKGDTIIFEQYFEDHNEYVKSNSFSVAKSIVSILIGIAVDEGLIDSIDDPVSKYLPEFKNGEKDKISIRHLLNMSAGLSWDERSSALSDNAEAYYGWDLAEKITQMKVVEDPGEIFDYKSGYTQVLGFIIKKVSGMTVSEYASKKIWSKIGAESSAFWGLDDDEGMEKSFCCVYATTRDFARIGKLANNYGKWEGKSIVSSSYMMEMVTPEKSLTRRNGMVNDIYGLSWWVLQGEGEQVFYARGILGQYIICLPARDMVIVRTGHMRGEVDGTAINDVNNPDYRRVDHPKDVFYYINIAKKFDNIYKSNFSLSSGKEYEEGYQTP